MTGSRDAIAQYLELYRLHRDTIDNACGSEPLNNMRHAAFAALDSLPMHLPRRGDEGYATTDLNAMFAPDYGLNITRLPVSADVAEAFRCDVPRLSTALAITVNDTPRLTDTALRSLPEGVWFGSLARFGREHPTLLERYYGALAPMKRPEVALNTLMAQDGIVLWVKKDVIVEKPLQIVNLLSASTPLMAVRRLLVVMEDGARATLLCCDHTMDCTNSYLSSAVTEIYLGRGASLSLFDLEESSPLTSRCAGVFIDQEENSELRLGSATLWCGTSRNDYEVALRGRGAIARLSGLVTGAGESLADTHTHISHLTPHCISRQLYKFALPEASRGSFRGRVYVAPGAAGTDAEQNCRNLLAGAEARMHTEPQLEIYCDDVKCSHGAATGQLSADALFYMRQRGIPEAEARAMLMQAFMADVVDTFTMDGLRDRLRHLVEKRLSGAGPEACSGCNASCSPSKSSDSSL
ncbi:MAG: Fe-S cluster assembly protein SufD [Bacteroides sp.]|nr:Fe-S cluster assembly protein SufD [Bacteroides sp.]